MSKVLVAVMAATVFTMLGAAWIATSYSMSVPSQWAARVVEGPRSTHFKTSQKVWVPEGSERGPSPATEAVPATTRLSPNERWI